MRVAPRLWAPKTWPRMIKRWLPTSLFGRSLLIIVLPVAMMQVAVTWAFFEAHWQTVTAQLSESLAGDVAWDVAAYLEDPTSANLGRIAERAERTQPCRSCCRRTRACRSAGATPSFQCSTMPCAARSTSA
jgi:two-component system, OmpR family, osmolarity sensor histidine kinase EnvZ